MTVDLSVVLARQAMETRVWRPNAGVQEPQLHVASAGHEKQDAIIGDRHADTAISMG